jgi:CubicO group peptidase (beta-lactamase class C family)
MLFFGSLLFVCFSSTDISFGPERERVLHTYIQAFEERRDFSGVVRITHKNEVLFEKAYGWTDFAKRIPVQVDTRFLTASVTKTMTAAAVVRLRDMGIWALEDPIGKYLPSFPHGKKITILHLLAHKSGVTDFHQMDEFATILQRRNSLSELVERIGREPLQFEPGTSGQYNNAGFVLLAHLIETVSGKSYESFLREQFFAPLGMNNTGLFNADGQVKGYKPGPPPQQVVQAESFDVSYAVGSGAMTSTAADLHRWGGAIASRKPVDIFAEPWPWGWGKGEREGVKWLSQTGMMPGYICVLLVFPEEDLTVVYLGNIQSFAFNRFQKDLPAIVFGWRHEPPPTRLPKPEQSWRFTGVEGSYDLVDIHHFKIAAQKDHYYFTWKGATESNYLLPLEGGRLYMRQEDAMLTVKRDKEGRVEGLHFKSHWTDKYCPRLD